MADKPVKIRNTENEFVNPSTEETMQELILALAETTGRLNQLIAKIPVGMHVNAGNKLKVITETDASIINYPFFQNSSSSMINYFDGPIQTRQVWQQQRSQINV